MPLLDPALQYNLIYYENRCKMKDKNQKKQKPNSFFLYYLEYASKNIFKNRQTIEASVRFGKDLKSNCQLVNSLFGCNFTKEADFNESRNYYQYLLDNIDLEYKQQCSKSVEGRYISFYNNFQTTFFQPDLIDTKTHSWFLSTTPIAVLCIKYLYFKDNDYSQFIKLEINLMAAAGFTLILSVYYDPWEKDDPWKVEDSEKIVLLASFYPFSEIHFNIDRSNVEDNSSINKIFFYLDKALSSIYGYLYIYIPRICYNKYQNFYINEPRIKIIPFSLNLDSFFKEINPIITKPFVYCKNGFDDDYLCIQLFNVPIYDSEDKNDFLCSTVSKLSRCYILKKDFLSWKPKRIQIIYEDQNKNNRHFIKYINFSDIHVIKSNLFVLNNFALADVDEKIYQEIKLISEYIHIHHSFDVEFFKQNFFSLLKNEKIKKILFYVSYAYMRYAGNFINKNFYIHDNQIYAAMDSIKNCLSHSANGNIYKIDTGEGKSCIIQVIAASLALMKKNVHIASSNINLSNRDYYTSFPFFQKLGLKSAVLLHYNELPYLSLYNKNDDDDINYDRKYFPDEYFHDKLFDNSLNINLSICGINNNNELTKNKVDIVFSTFLNFECLCLKMMEMCPTYIPKYFSGCSLLIDEADSILIDELTNGTILSRSIKTNANEILKYVYQCKMDGIQSDIVFENVKKNWPKCTDLTLENINDMFREIDIVNQDEFTDGKKYSIESFEIEKEKSLNGIINNIKDKVENIKTNVKDEIKNTFSKKHRKNKDKKHKHHHKDSTKNKEHKKKKKVYKQIIPFDYDHKGILEPNKEFSGFIQQFIAIKEMFKNKENSNMIIKDVTINYLYISHPIFVKLYSGVSGFTGTIGNSHDKKIYMEQYNLLTKIIPRENKNFRVEYPMILCKDINERNEKIVEEIIYLHQKENPILAIFQNLNEISNVLTMLISRGIKNVNIFDGKDEKMKPDLISGLKGAISLGTNVCGRGTDIKKPYKPLHVIVSFYTSNSRVMNQAFGRTARQGQEGTVRIICLLSQFLSPIYHFNQKVVSNLLNDFQCKNEYQIKFIDQFKKNREWIFSVEMKSQRLNNENLEILRESRINVNRINAFNYEYPICMSVQTFLDIQSQKIFSLYNCPNCKYTWMLFQKYIREMILESWSIFIEKTDKKFAKKERIISYSNYLEKKYNKLIKLIEEYIPNFNFDIISTFMFIYNKVVKKYELKIMNAFQPNLTKMYKNAGIKQFCLFSFGFKPFSLIDNSGSRLNTIDGSDQEFNYISDPELKYMKKQPSGLFSLLSITERIDGIFNWICRKINEVIGCYIGLRFFLRRTLGGCEFGVCFDFDLQNNDENIDLNCLIDKDPLFLFTITVKSMIPFLAGILIIGLVYIASISKNIAEWIFSFPTKITKELVKKTLVNVASVILSSQIEILCDSVCSFLLKILNDQVEQMEKFNFDIASLFKLMMKIIIPNDFSSIGDKLNKLINDSSFFKMNSNLGKSFIKDNIPSAHFLKIGFLLMLCFASFMFNFNFNRKSLKFDLPKAAADYDKNQDTEKALRNNQKNIEMDKVSQLDQIEIDLNNEQ